jgi:uncharacterized repeat protein (TIGR01451 family)
MAGLKGIARRMFILISLMISIQSASAALPPSIDMNVSKIACNDTHCNISEVEAGSQFYYNISVNNTDPLVNATGVVVTDKLPYEVTYISTKVWGPGHTDLTDQVDIHQTGDLLYINFNETNVTRDNTTFINITVTAPTEAPTTLYNIVNLRYANDPNPDDNTYTLATYVPQTGYDKRAAVESFEELLHNQTRLLFDFEDLLHVVPRTPEDNYTFIASFEQLLRAQQHLTLSFEDLLENQTNDGWDQNFSPTNRIFFLKSFKRIVWDQAFLLSSFEMKLKSAWTYLYNDNDNKSPGHTQDMQTEFIASFENLLHTQVKAYDSYQMLMKTVGGGVSSQDKTDALAAYENLLRVQANLLMSFEDVLKMKYQDPLHTSQGSQLSLTVRSRWLDFSQLTSQYTITVSNIGNTTANLTTLTSSYQFAYDSTTGQVELLLAGGQSPGWADTIEGQSAHYEDPLPTLNPGESREFKMTLHVFPLELGELRNYVTVASDVESLTTGSIIRKTTARAPPLQGNETNETA